MTSGAHVNMCSTSRAPFDGCLTQEMDKGDGITPEYLWTSHVVTAHCPLDSRK